MRTVNDLILEVRSRLDNDNQYGLSDELDILPALNSAQDKAFTILARKYEEPLLTYQTVTMPDDQAFIDLPEAYYQDRLDKVEFSNSGTWQEVERISYRDATRYDRQQTAAYPRFFAIVGREVRLYPPIAAGSTLRFWGLSHPERLVASQGRITRVSTTGNYVVLDEAGSDLTSAMDQLNSYANVIDGRTGVVKATLQVQSVADSRVTFKSVPTRSTVLGRTVSGSMTDLGVEEDDYLCTIKGTCVPLVQSITGNFMIQYAAAFLKASGNDEGAVLAKNVLDDFEKELERTWVGRETTLRVKRASVQWNRI